MGVLENCNPKDVFHFFEEICAVPRGSGHTDKIVEFLLKFAADHKLEAEKDGANNVIIRKKGSPGYENSPTMILQGHHDMVCEKIDGLDFNFETDGIQPVLDGDWIRAKGTTLGGDNGIAVAMMLAILDRDDLPHPPLEMLITADEEIGMLGAFAFDCSKLTGHKLINLDSEYEGILMCSCAGGANAYSTIPVEREEKTLASVKLEISGLISGHSGVEIDKGRANSNVLMARLLQTLSAKAPIQIAAMEGGSRETAIAAKSTAVIGVPAQAIPAAAAEAEACGAVFSKEYAAAEPAMTVSCSVGEEQTMRVLTPESSARAWRSLLALPDSVQAMSMDMPGLVQTSTNLGLMKLTDTALTFANTVRSSMTTQKRWILEKVSAIVALAGGTTEISGSYPGWSYNPHSVLKDTIVQAYQNLFGREAKVDAVHAGIECGLFADAIENLDCVAIGPDMADVHTPREHLSVSSTERTYALLLETLRASR